MIIILGINIMKMIEIKSSNIMSIGYDSKKRIMNIEFHRGRVYSYYHVSNRIFQGMIKTDSKGKYFHKMINGVYSYKWINKPLTKKEKV